MDHISTSNLGFVSNRLERIQLSKHAKKRCQQRGGEELQIPLIKLFGEVEHDGHRAVRYVMTKSSMQNLYRAIGYTKKLEQIGGRYIVVSTEDGTVITYGHSYQ